MKSCDVLIFGCGYLGIPVARSMLHRGHRVVAVTRSPTRARFLETLGLIPFIGDWLDARSLHGIPVAQHTLVAVGFDRQGSRSQRDVYVEGLRNALGVLNPDTKLVYCSSTGVYHQFDGVWVDESSPCRPTREGGKAHLEAEELLWRLRPDQATVVLRLAGLYGPGRAPRSREVVAGLPVPANPDGWLNLIHQHDAAATVIAAWNHPHPERLYVVSDGYPTLRRGYYEELARILRAPPPTFQLPDEATMKGTRASTDKRIWSRRCRRDLLPEPLFPSYRSGLRDCFKKQP